MKLKTTLKSLLCCAGMAAPFLTVCAAGPHEFEAGKGAFLLDGKPFLIRAGELHYARIPREYWDHRIKMTKALGMNTICMYLFWNYHEPEMDQFDFEGEKDFVEFVKLIQENGMYCILRPGPYSCAEWEMGGLPWWLLKKNDLKIRTFKDELFRERAKKWLAEVGKRLAPYQIQNGGPIILVQVENEYACFGNDGSYMEGIRDTLRESGFDKVTLMRCDWGSNFDSYRVDGVTPCINFGAGSNVDREFDKLKRERPDAPLMCSEYWTGWFDHWGKPHETRGVESFIGSLKDMLDRNISFSLYMAHGGTTFAHWGGANSPPYSSMVASYDYNAPITEAGWTTDKFFAVRNLLKNYMNDGETLAEVPAQNPVMELPDQPVGKGVPLLAREPLEVRTFNREDLDWKEFGSNFLMTMERCDLGYGMILYGTKLSPSESGLKLRMTGVHDFAHVYVDGKPLDKTVDRRLNQDTVQLPEFDKAVRLDILVENNGRVNYGEAIMDRKGITKTVELLDSSGRVVREISGDHGGSVFLWQIFTFPYEYEFMKAAAKRGSRRSASPIVEGGPVLYTETVNVPEPADTFLDMSTFGKGMVWLNGRNLGRYWMIGPQQTLYVPGCWLKKGENELLILDTMPTESPVLKWRREPVLDRIQSDLSLKHRKPGQELDLSGETPAIRGTLPNAEGWQTVRFDKPVTGRYLCLEALSEQGGSRTMTSAAELIAFDADGRDISRLKWTIVYADSEETDRENNSAENLIDQQESTFWHSEWSSRPTNLPHQVVIDMGEPHTVGGFRILPRTDRNTNGRIRDFRFFVKENPFKF